MTSNHCTCDNIVSPTGYRRILLCEDTKFYFLILIICEYRLLGILQERKQRENF